MEENYFLHYDEQTGEILGFYLRNIHGNIPSPYIEITPEKHKFYMENSGKYRLDTLTLEDVIEEVAPVPITQPTTEERLTLLEQAMDEMLLGGAV